MSWPGLLLAGFALERGYANAVLAVIAAVVLGALALGVLAPALRGARLQTYRTDCHS